MHAVPIDEEPVLESILKRRARWGAASFGEQADTLEACLDATARVAHAWVRAGHAAKGLPADHAEEWFTGPVPVIRGLRLWAASLRRLHEGRSPVQRDRCERTPDGRVAVRTFPTDAYDAALFRGFATVQRMQPDWTEDDVLSSAGASARARRGGLCAVLGAGNVSSIPALDALTKCVNEQVPAVVKLSPVNDWVAPFLEEGLAPLIERGALAFVRGGPEVGARLVAHPEVTEVHVTGSDATHDRLVWGTADPEARGERPVLDEPVTSELGNVTPVAVVPGDYTEPELDFLAHQVVAMVTNNASFNCVAAKVLVLAEGWHQKEAFLRRLESGLRRVPTRAAYYPGARERFESLVEGRTDVERIGRETEERLPWTLIRGLDASDPTEPLFRTEPFCPVLSLVELDVPDAVAFIVSAEEFMDERLWGTLGATWFVSGEQEKLRPVSDALEGAIARQRYGTVAVNHWPALAFGWVSPAWGGHPSSGPENIQSGRGWVHNTYLLEGVEKTVLRGPMPVFPKPVWFADHRHAHDVGRRMVSFERRPRWLELPGLVFPALLG